jgi:uncharacterized membrane protein
MELLQAIEQLGFVRLLKTSFIAYPVVNALHIAAIGALFTSVLLMDLSVLGAIRAVPREKLVALLRRVALIAFALAVVTGLTLFSVRATHYAETPVFLLKLGLIGLAILNFLVFNLIERRNPAAVESVALRLSVIASILLWSGALLAGRFIGFV